MTHRSYHRAIGLIVGGVGVFLITELGRDLFFAIPWPVRKGFGWVGFFGLGGYFLKRMVVGGGLNSSSLPDGARHGSDRWPAIGLAGLCAVLAFPILRHPGYLGFGDWDLFLGKYEAARRTILLWGQFPWWDPWSRGGFPLAANPQCGVLGVAMPLVLLFGTTVGLRLATIVCFMLAAEGARRLARVWLVDPVAAATVGLIYALNGGVLVAAVAAYHVSMCYPSLPWMLYFIFRLERRPVDGLWLGAWGAFNLLNGIQYFTVYIILIVAIVWLRRAWNIPDSDRRRLIAHTVLASGTFLLLTGWRLATTLLVYHDFPRSHSSVYSESLWSMIIHVLNRPSAKTLAAMDIPYFWETTCYTGPIVPFLALLSIRRGWRWWHTLAAGCFWLASGALQWYQPSYWLAHFPLFATMHVVTRWRFMAMLGVALAAGSTLAEWRKSDRRFLRRLALLAIALIGFDYISYGFEVLPVAFSVRPVPDLFPGPDLRAGPIVQVAESQGFTAISRGYGVILGYEPLIGYDRRAPTARSWREADSYVAEHWTDRGPVTPEFWSPNAIVLKVEPHEVVYVNQNPGSWWRVNGEILYGGLRCAEKDRPFEARADAMGRLVLKIHPRGLELGAALHGIGLLMVVSTLMLLRSVPLARGRSAPRQAGVSRN